MKKSIEKLESWIQREREWLLWAMSTTVKEACSTILNMKTKDDSWGGSGANKVDSPVVQKNSTTRVRWIFFKYNEENGKGNENNGGLFSNIHGQLKKGSQEISKDILDSSSNISVSRTPYWQKSRSTIIWDDGISNTDLLIWMPDDERLLNSIISDIENIMREMALDRGNNLVIHTLLVTITKWLVDAIHNLQESMWIEILSSRNVKIEFIRHWSDKKISGKWKKMMNVTSWFRGFKWNEMTRLINS